MKNRKKLMFGLMVVALVAPMAFSLAACEQEPETLVLDAPNSVILSGETLFWSRVANADGYNIFAGNRLYGTTSSTIFIISESARTHNLYIQAFADTANGIVRSPNSSPAHIIGDYGVTYNNSEILVDQRNSLLTIELHNVYAVGRHGSNGGTGQNGGDGRPVISMGNNIARVPNLAIVSQGTRNGLYGGNGGASINANNIVINIGGINTGTGTVIAIRSQGGDGGSRWRGQGLFTVAQGGTNGSSGAQGEQFTSTPRIQNGFVTDQR